jgi:hypothetical protein
MNPPIPRVWLGLALMFAIAAAAVITNTVDGWTRLVPVSGDVPLLTRHVLLTLELTVLAVVLEATWWAVWSRRSRSRSPS